MSTGIYTQIGVTGSAKNRGFWEFFYRTEMPGLATVLANSHIR